jgi:histidinol dehydrogenase
MLRLNSRDPGFEKAFKRLVTDRRESGEDVARDVQVILSDVKNRGDAALAEMTARFDGYALNRCRLVLSVPRNAARRLMR